MRWSKLFIPTLRATPPAEGPGRALLIRAGYIRPCASGADGYLPLAQRSFGRIARQVHAEMERLGALEVGVPAAAQLPLVARGDLRSYKQLPLAWYSLADRTLSACWFGMDGVVVEAWYEKFLQAFRRLAESCGLAGQAADASLEGIHAEDLVLPLEASADRLAACPACSWLADWERAAAVARPPAGGDPTGDLAPEPFPTPGQKTIDDVARFTGLPATSQIKSLVLMAGDKPVLALVRGDHQLSEAKFAAASGFAPFRPARPEEIRQWFGADAGSLGPLDSDQHAVRGVRLIGDLALRGRRNLIAGANRNDYHLRNVTPGEDFSPEWHDLRLAVPGDGCPRCGAPLEMRPAFRLAHLAAGHEGEPLDLHVAGADSREAPVRTGGCGLTLDRLLAAAAALYHDANGLVWPPAVAPFDVVVTPANYGDPAQRQAADAIYGDCLAAGLDALLDDRDERPGVKFKDADLIGIPRRIVVGRKLETGMVECIERATLRTREVAPGDAAATVRAASG
ncbi:MAG: proline--tRNA ligase [Bryobacteraceae bacterium]